MDQKKRKAESGKTKPAGKHPGGRPTIYRAEYAGMAFRHTLLGATDKDLAALFGTSEQTINAWKQKHPKFLESIKEGKEEADTKVAESLYKRATGMSVPAVKIFNTEEGPIEHPYREYHPPETAAAIFWLKNRKPQLFRQNPEVAVTVNNETSVDLSKPPEEWGQAEIEAELRRRGAMPVPPKLNGNGHGQ